jgi:hypothetical protein
MLQSGIKSCNYTWPSWDHEGVEYILIQKYYKGKDILSYPIYKDLLPHRWVTEYLNA